MKVTREELIHIHKRIWNEVREYISHSHGEIDSLLFIKERCIHDMANKNEVSQQSLNLVYVNSACVFFAPYFQQNFVITVLFTIARHLSHYIN